MILLLQRGSENLVTIKVTGSLAAAPKHRFSMFWAGLLFQYFKCTGKPYKPSWLYTGQYGAGCHTYSDARIGMLRQCGFCKNRCFGGT
jgi:hypothetical protein